LASEIPRREVTQDSSAGHFKSLQKNMSMEELLRESVARGEKVALVTLTEGGGIELMGNKTLVEIIKTQKKTIESKANAGAHENIDIFVKEAKSESAPESDQPRTPAGLASLPPEVQELVVRELEGAACLALAAACPALRPALEDHQRRLELEARRQLEELRAEPALERVTGRVAAMTDLLVRLTAPRPLRRQLKEIICKRFPVKNKSSCIEVLCPERRALAPLGFLMLARAEAVDGVLEVRLGRGPGREEPSLSGALLLALGAIAARQHQSVARLVVERITCSDVETQAACAVLLEHCAAWRVTTLDLVEGAVGAARPGLERAVARGRVQASPLLWTRTATRGWAVGDASEYAWLKDGLDIGA
jgi:hypothetical protein